MQGLKWASVIERWGNLTGSDKTLKERKAELMQRIQNLRMRQGGLARKVSAYPPLPHDSMSEQEIRDRNQFSWTYSDISRAIDEYSSLVLESSESYLADLAADTKTVKSLTKALVILTGVLAGITIVDVLIRVGIL